MSNPVSSIIFAYRNVHKTENGEIGRAPVFVGQAANVVSEVAKFDNIVGSSTKAATSIFSNIAEKNKPLKYITKGVKFASENVNPLICASSVLKVATAKDKKKTAIVEAGALSGMFMGEGLMKKYQDSIFSEKNVENVVKKIADKGIMKSVMNKILESKASGKVGTIVKGLTFVCASMSSYAIGQKFAENFAKSV